MKKNHRGTEATEKTLFENRIESLLCVLGVSVVKKGRS